LLRIRDAAQNGKPPWFRSRKKDTAGFNDDTQPLAKKISMGKARLTIVMLSSKGEKLHQKMQLHDKLDQWPRRCKAAS
jgi:hypothetical protein